MTTNALDIVNRKVATDSRWSIDTPHTLFYVDDTGFDKIGLRKKYGIIFAGDSKLIDGWKSWFAEPALRIDRMPLLGRRDPMKGVVSITVMLIELPTGGIKFRYGWLDNQGDAALFAGTGANHARNCFLKNGCIMQAVTSAAKNDPATGGDVKFLEMVTGNHNLTEQAATLDEMHEQLRQRGYAMDKATGQVMTIAAHEAKANVMSNLAGMTLSAPTGMPELQWTPSAIAEFKAVLEEIAAEEAADRAQ